MRILELHRLGERTASCVYEDEWGQYTIKVSLLVDGDIKGLQLKEIAPDVRRRLYDSPEGLDFAKQLRRYFDGEKLVVPIELGCAAKSEH